MSRDENATDPLNGWLDVERGTFPGWDPDPLDATPPEPDRRESRRWGCSVAVITLILALSGVPGVVAGGVGPTPRGAVQLGVTPAAVTVTAERHLGAPDALAVVAMPSEAAGAPPTSDIGTAIYTASATWCAPTPDKCTDWGGNARLAAVNSFAWGDEPYLVRVYRGEMYVDVTVVSHCGCFGEDGYIDLSPAAFEVLAPLGIGRIDVEVEVLTDLAPHPDDDRMRVEDGGPPMPQTDTAP